MDEPIEEIYFKWLYSKMSSVEVPTPSLTYWTLFRDLHSIEFVWLVSGDDNRAEDGLDLRKEFIRQSRYRKDTTWMSMGCSVLEMLIAFSRKAEFETGMESSVWFWIFLKNLGIDDLNDSAVNISINVRDALEQFIWRTYEPDGTGGLFPLRHAEHDQRKVELWYQFCEYLVDQENE